MNSRSRFSPKRALACSIFGFAVALIPAIAPCSAAVVKNDLARRVATSWAARSSLMSAAQSIASDAVVNDDSGRPLFHIVEFAPTGFIIVPADDSLEPVIAYSGDSAFSREDGAALFPFLIRDVSERIAAAHSPSALSVGSKTAGPITAKWAELLNNTTAPEALGVTSITGVCVAPLTKTKWSQSSVYSGGKYVSYYNYYTPPGPEGSPDNYVTGCTATAKAQILRFHQWPKVGVGTASFDISVNGGTSYKAPLRGGDGAGGPYDWSNMPETVPTSVSLAQQKAVGALLFDAGIVGSMNYAPGGSGGYVSASQFTGPFKYGSAQNWYSSNIDPLEDSLNTSLSAGLPCLIGIWSKTAGHEVVVDGYAVSGGTTYHHLNMGWGGSNDAWYALPNVDDSFYGFTSVSDATVNIDPVGCGLIVAGRVLDKNGTPLAGATVTIDAPLRTTLTSAYGVYAFKGNATQTKYRLNVLASGHTFLEQSVTTGSSGTYAIGNRALHFTELDPSKLTAQTISFTNPGLHTFGDAAFDLSGSASSGLAISFSVVSGPATLSGAKLTITGTGSITVQANQAGDSTYASAPSVKQTFTVNPAPSTFIVTNTTFNYDGAAHGPTISSSGTYAVKQGQTSGTDAGTYSFTLTPNGNYTGAEATYSWTIKPAVSTFTVTDRQIFTYDGSTHGPAIASNGTYAIDSGLVTASAPGTYTFTLKGTGNYAGTSQVITFTIVNSRLINISTRAWVGTDGDVLIAGLVVPGSKPKQVLIRAAGPALAALGVSGALADPVMELHDAIHGNVIIATNDNWSTDTAAADAITAAGSKLGAFAWTRGSNDAAMLVTLQPGVYSVLVSGSNRGTGIAMIEAYDADSDTNPTRLANISSRSQAKLGDQAQIAGFVISGVGPVRILIRAAGPALTPLGVTGVLPNPTLELHDSSRVIAVNDDWSSTSSTASSIETVAAAIGASAWQRGTKDAALLVTLDPGAYSALVKDPSGATGNALIEVYEAP